MSADPFQPFTHAVQIAAIDNSVGKANGIVIGHIAKLVAEGKRDSLRGMNCSAVAKKYGVSVELVERERAFQLGHGDQPYDFDVVAVRNES